MKNILFAALLALLISVTSILVYQYTEHGGYEITKASENHLIRYNKYSGQCDLLIVENQRLDVAPASSFSPGEREYDLVDQLDAFNTLPAVTNKNLISSTPITFNIVTTHRENKLLYRLSVSPFCSELDKIRSNRFNSITVQFSDILGFPVAEEEINFYEMTRMLGESNQVASLEYISEIPLTEESYKLIAYASIPWSIADEE